MQIKTNYMVKMAKGNIVIIDQPIQATQINTGNQLYTENILVVTTPIILGNRKTEKDWSLNP